LDASSFVVTYPYWSCEPLDSVTETLAGIADVTGAHC